MIYNNYPRYQLIAGVMFTGSLRTSGIGQSLR